MAWDDVGWGDVRAVAPDGFGLRDVDSATAVLDGEPAWLAVVAAVLGAPASALVVRHVELLSAGGMRTLAALLAAVARDLRRAATRATLTRFERAKVHAIFDALAEAGGNRKVAASLLGISRSTLYRKLQAAGVDLENTVY